MPTIPCVITLESVIDLTHLTISNPLQFGIYVQSTSNSIPIMLISHLLYV